MHKNLIIKSFLGNLELASLTIRFVFVCIEKFKKTLFIRLIKIIYIRYLIQINKYFLKCNLKK